MRRLILVAVIASVLALFGATETRAALFIGDTLPTFGAPVQGGIQYSIANGTFGSPTSTFSTGAINSPTTGSQNVLTMTGNSFDSAPETPFKAATLSYYNGVTILGTSADSVPVILDLRFSSPFSGTETFLFSFAFEITPNITGNDLQDADTLTPVNVFALQTFEIGAATYTLKLLGFSQDGGNSYQDEFVLPENQTAESDLFVEITTNLRGDPVPEPSALAVWSLLALCGVGFGWRRRRKAA